jgi:hypothetical protein
VITGGVGFRFEEGGEIAPSGISPFLSTTKGSEGMTDAESRNRLGNWVSATSQCGPKSVFRKWEDHCADLVITVGGRRDERLVSHRCRWQMEQSVACLGYSMGHPDEVPSLLVVAIFYWKPDQSSRR